MGRVLDFNVNVELSSKNRLSIKYKKHDGTHGSKVPQEISFFAATNRMSHLGKPYPRRQQRFPPKLARFRRSLGRRRFFKWYLQSPKLQPSINMASTKNTPRASAICQSRSFQERLPVLWPTQASKQALNGRERIPMSRCKLSRTDRIPPALPASRVISLVPAVGGLQFIMADAGSLHNGQVVTSHFCNGFKSDSRMMQDSHKQWLHLRQYTGSSTIQKEHTFGDGVNLAEPNCSRTFLCCLRRPSLTWLS